MPPGVQPPLLCPDTVSQVTSEQEPWRRGHRVLPAGWVALGNFLDLTRNPLFLHESVGNTTQRNCLLSPQLTQMKLSFGKGYAVRKITVYLKHRRFCPLSYPYWCSGAAITKCHSRGLRQQECVVSRFWSLKFKIKGLARHGPSEGAREGPVPGLSCSFLAYGSTMMLFI